MKHSKVVRRVARNVMVIQNSNMLRAGNDIRSATFEYKYTHRGDVQST
jgi:hypothetical protein